MGGALKWDSQQLFAPDRSNRGTTWATSRPAASSLLCTQWELFSAPAITLRRIIWSTRLPMLKGHSGPQSSPRRHQRTKTLPTCTNSLLWNHLLGMHDFLLIWDRVTNLGEV